jgi:hypothetical protein
MRCAAHAATEERPSQACRVSTVSEGWLPPFTAVARDNISRYLIRIFRTAENSRKNHKKWIHAFLIKPNLFLLGDIVEMRIRS